MAINESKTTPKQHVTTDEKAPTKAEEVNLKPIAGGGLLDRRLFLKKGFLYSSAAVLPAALQSAHAEVDETALKVDQAEQNKIDPANPPWMREAGKAFTNYGQPSPHESHTIRWISENAMAAGNGVSWSPLHELEGMITPNGLHYERHHNGVPQIDPEEHRLVIHGLVDQALKFTVDDLLRYPMQSRICFIECGGNSNGSWNTRPLQAAAGHMHGLVSCSEWTGVPLKILLQEAGLKSQASWLIAESADGIAMNMSLPMEKALDDTILALYQNGERLRPENGYPMRLVVPGWEGVTNVKWLRRLELTDQPVMSRNETAKYSDLLPSGNARQFSYVMEAKSVITSPCAGHQLDRHGIFQISGLAWSGRGKVARVDVSADGGQTWAEAALDGPVLDRAFTRFRIPFEWQGEPSVIMSRVTDETGYVQPTREALIEERGRHGYYHYNAIVSWAIDEDGFVSHVYA